MSQDNGGGAYREAGVDIDAQESALARIKDVARATFGPEVLTDIGSFGGLFRPNLEDRIARSAIPGVWILRGKAGKSGA